MVGKIPQSLANRPPLLLLLHDVDSASTVAVVVLFAVVLFVVVAVVPHVVVAFVPNGERVFRHLLDDHKIVCI